MALVQTLLALAAVCVLAWVVLRWASRRGLGIHGGRGRVQVLERTPLEPRRALYLVRIGDRVLLLGAGEGASPTVLAELDPSELPPEPESASRLSTSFAELLKRKS